MTEADLAVDEAAAGDDAALIIWLVPIIDTKQVDEAVEEAEAVVVADEAEEDSAQVEDLQLEHHHHQPAAEGETGGKYMVEKGRRKTGSKEKYTKITTKKGARAMRFDGLWSTIFLRLTVNIKAVVST